jgi:hypothetical protein
MALCILSLRSIVINLSHILVFNEKKDSLTKKTHCKHIMLVQIEYND